MATKEYKPDDKPKFYDELLAYSTSKFEANTRQYAIVNLLYLNKMDRNVYPNLINGLVHHKWQFVKFAKDKIRELMKQEIFKLYFQEMLSKVPEAEKVQLERLF